MQIYQEKKNNQCFVFGLSLVNKKYNLPRLRRRKSSRPIAERNKVKKLQSNRLIHLPLFIRLIEVQNLYNIYINRNVLSFSVNPDLATFTTEGAFCSGFT